MNRSRYEEEEYLEPDEEELEAAARRRKLIVLVVMAALVIAGIVLVNKLRIVSQLQDCLMTRATNCNDLVTPPSRSASAEGAAGRRGDPRPQPKPQ